MKRDADMSNQMKQLFTLYHALPRAPKHAVTIQQLMQDTTIQAEYDSSAQRDSIRKKISRHLDELSDLLSVSLEVKDTSPKTYRLPESAYLDHHSPHAALMMLIADNFLTKILPQSSYEHVAGLFSHAKKQLEKHTKLKNWQSRIYYDNMTGKEVKGTPIHVEQKIYDALLEDKPISVQYLGQGQDESREFKGYPLKLVVRPFDRMLIMDNPKYNDTLTLLLHRIQQVVILDGFDIPERVKIDLKDMNISAHTEYQYDYEPICLKLMVDQSCQYLVTDNPLFNTVNTVIDDDAITITDILWSESLLDFLMVNADSVFVLSPLDLQMQVKNCLADGLRNYDITHR